MPLILLKVSVLYFCVHSKQLYNKLGLQFHVYTIMRKQYFLKEGNFGIIHKASFQVKNMEYVEWKM